MIGHLKRLLRTGSAYQAAELLAKVLAVITLPLYTRHVGAGQYGAYQALFTAVILASVLLRAGLGEAYIRLYFDDQDAERRRQIARNSTAAVAWLTTGAMLLAFIFAGSLGRLLLGAPDAALVRSASIGLWAFTNLEMAYAQLRVEERAGAYLRASALNVLLSVSLTIGLVVFAGLEAQGLLLGNFIASAVVVLGLWWLLRESISLRVDFRALGRLLRFGLPTVPADAAVYTLQVADRFFLYRNGAPGKSAAHAIAGDYSVALQLATVVFVFVRGFQYAWPPLIYSVAERGEAARLYSLVCTYFSLFTGAVVVAVALLGRWLVRLLAAPEYFAAHEALPWLALAWMLYGLYRVMFAITAHAKATTRNVPPAIAGAATNIALLFLLVPRSTLNLGMTGAAIALCASYVVMLAAMLALTRKLFAIPFEWARLAALTLVLSGVAASGELLLPASGALGFFERALWWLWLPLILHLVRFFSAAERARARNAPAQAMGWLAQRRSGRPSSMPPELESYAEDPLRER